MSSARRQRHRRLMPVISSIIIDRIRLLRRWKNIEEKGLWKEEEVDGGVG